MADSDYKAVAFPALAGASLDGVSEADREKARAVLAERAQASANAMAAWPLEVASYTPQVRAVLDSLVTWRMAWQAWHAMPDGGREGYEERTAALAAADVADDELADLADSLIAWRQDMAERTAKDAARQARLEARALIAWRQSEPERTARDAKREARRAAQRKANKDALKPKVRR